MVAVMAVGIGSSANAVSTKIGDTTLTIGGFVKANAMWTDYEDGGPLSGLSEEILVPSTIPVGDSSASEGYQFDTHISTSRLGFKTATPTENGNVSTNLEFDMLSKASASNLGNERISNSAVFRIRHAVLNWDFSENKTLTLGQTWSTFFNVGALPESVDFIGPTSGVIFNRQWQARITKKLDNGGKFMVALENPSSSVYGLSNNIDDNKVPDIVLRYSGKAGDLAYTVAGIVREIAYDNTATGGDDDSVFGGGVSVSGKLALSGKDDLKFMVSHGTLGRYIALQAFQDADLEADGDLDLVDVTGGFIAYRHWWNNKTRSTFQYAMTTADLPDSLAGATTEEVSNLEVSLITSPTKNLDLGTGFIQAKRELENGTDGTLSRIQFFGKLKF